MRLFRFTPLPFTSVAMADRRSVVCAFVKGARLGRLRAD